MKIMPLAFDSLGVRSVAIFIQTDLNIVIDPRLSFAPLRYGLVPSKLELRGLRNCQRRYGNMLRRQIFLPSRIIIMIIIFRKPISIQIKYF